MASSTASSLRHLWNHVPVYVTRPVEVLLASQGQPTSSFNENVAAAALEAFRSYVDTKRGRSSSRSSNPGSPQSQSGGRRRRARPASSSISTSQQPIATVPPISSLHESNDQLASDNDHFFEYQKSRGYHLSTEATRKSPEIQQLYDEILPTAIEHYLRSVKVETNVLDWFQDPISTRKIDLWMAVQQGPTACHPNHTHEDAIVSGVYYAQMPPGSAPLVFQQPTDSISSTSSIKLSSTPQLLQDEEDQFVPRIPPECGDDSSTTSIEFHPRDGDLILFPPWLVHGVPPPPNRPEKSESTISSRVSLAFNVTGHTRGESWKVIRNHHGCNE